MSVTFIAVARRFKSPKRRARRCARAAVDGTGLSHNAASTFLIRRMEQRPRGMTRWSYWLKWLVVTDLDNLVILAQHGRQAPWCDCRSLPDLVDAACEASPIGLVLADAEFDTEQNHRHIREQVGAHSIIPAKRGRSVGTGPSFLKVNPSHLRASRNARATRSTLRWRYLVRVSTPSFIRVQWAPASSVNFVFQVTMLGLEKSLMVLMWIFLPSCSSSES